MLSFGNPFPLRNPNNSEERRACVKEFAELLRASPAFAARIRRELAGCSLACCCSSCSDPSRRRLCHGHVLFYVANCSDDDFDAFLEPGPDGDDDPEVNATALRACLLQHEAQASALDDHWQLRCGVPAEDGAVQLADALAGEMPGSAEAFAKEDERYFGPPTCDARAFAGGVRAQLRSSWPEETLPDNEARTLQWEATYESEATGRRERKARFQALSLIHI